MELQIKSGDKIASRVNRILKQLEEDGSIEVFSEHQAAGKLITIVEIVKRKQPLQQDNEVYKDTDGKVCMRIGLRKKAKHEE
ncbi:hypothetical protein CANCADRAFT_73203 [Tortispora caseinolytica NRRL Y-17796]|uniref:DNA/RNA-binding protein Alba-like domain-containing protein n=1 Tax=Tortispora caseinolytica NRRL Y-17796 TaxID=767744 RepID=A0A1E4TIN0_9ASCO|nr:hypothetical protein CANCADRAFT_73203 [Tortispora caseinolytica NRRL Y-17796]